MTMLLARAETCRDRPALRVADGAWVTYGALLDGADALGGALLDGRKDLSGARVAVHVAPGPAWVRAVWGVWRAGGIAVPLARSHPPAELAYALDETRAEAIVVDAAGRDALATLEGRVLIDVDSAGDAPLPPPPNAARDALILFTSGTTGRPKGVLLTHRALAAQVQMLCDAWRITGDDHILHHLPLHHVHGIVNALHCVLAVGGRVTLHDGFDADRVLDALGDDTRDLTLYMAVPTVYGRLLHALGARPPAARGIFRTAAARLRLMVSGSAALPAPLFDGWREATGHTLLERYGMTEFGMALSNPLDGARERGAVGRPLSGVEVRLVDGDGVPLEGPAEGALQVRSPGMFRGYWDRPDATVDAFVSAAGGAWFDTGDVAARDPRGVFRIRGRSSVDILKTGGEKVSALEIEDALLAHPAIAACAVVGLPHDDWGEEVAVALELTPGHTLSREEMRAFAKERLAPYKVPRRLLVVDALPRNAMGKVQKPAVAALFSVAE